MNDSSHQHQQRHHSQNNHAPHGDHHRDARHHQKHERHSIDQTLQTDYPVQAYESDTPMDQVTQSTPTGQGPALPPKSPRMLHSHQSGYPPRINIQPAGPATTNIKASSPAIVPRSPLLERLKQTFVNREPMSRTWAKKSYVDELDGVGVTDVESDRGGRGGGVRSAPASVIGEEVESQFQSPRNRPVSIYASPAAVAQFRALPPVGPEGQVVPAHPAMRI